MEVNLKTTVYGERLFLITSIVRIVGEQLTPEQLQRVCSILGKKYQIAATPNRLSDQTSLLVEWHATPPKRPFTIDHWSVQLEVTGEKVKLEYSKAVHRSMLADLYKRSEIIQATIRLGLWSFDTPRILYEALPFNHAQTNRQAPDIDAYRRYELGETMLPEEGIGLSVDVGTSFFTNKSVYDYFSSGQVRRFEELTARQTEHKGTLLYDGPRGKTKCHFEKYCAKLTLGTAPSQSFGGKTYQSPYDYFKREHPSFSVKPDDVVAYVSFPGVIGGGSVPVPANRLYIRVSNEMLEGDLSHLDKIKPDQREQLIRQFWERLGPTPFGEFYASLNPGFYQPSSTNSGIIPLQSLQFGKGSKLVSPAQETALAYSRHFRARKQYLEQYGCFYVPPTMHRDIYFAYPTSCSEKTAEALSVGIIEKITKLTGIAVESTMVPFDNYYEAIVHFQQDYESAMVVFVFEDSDPVIYFNISHELHDWKIKRITTQELNKKYRGLQKYLANASQAPKGEKNWQSFIDFCAYDVLEQLGCVPYMISPTLHYQMQLVIDVSEKSSHFGLSLFIWKDGMRVPVFDAMIKRKTDQKAETINPRFLDKALTDLLTQNRHTISRFKVRSMLILRDGKECVDEFNALVGCIDRLRGNVLPADFQFDFVEYHKTSQKELRLWERSGSQIDNVLEGSYVTLESRTAILATTGAGTLSQGTANVLMIQVKYTQGNLKAILTDIFQTSQLNFSSPVVAQRLTYPAKRADELLKDRRAQEVERIK